MRTTTSGKEEERAGVQRGEARGDRHTDTPLSHFPRHTGVLSHGLLVLHLVPQE